MVTGIEFIRYQTKYRSNEQHKKPSKTSRVAMIVLMLIRVTDNTLTFGCLLEKIRCFIYYHELKL